MDDYELVSDGFTNTSPVPMDKDLFYRCLNCSAIIPSVPPINISCKCGNITIDKDYGRLAVSDFSKFQVVRKKR